MGADRPDAAELIEACALHLGGLVAVGHAGRYDLRLLQRSLAVAGAEARLGAEHDAAEADSLRRLLDDDGSLDVLRARLAAEIRAGAWRLDDTVLLAHLRADTARRVVVSRG